MTLPGYIDLHSHLVPAVDDGCSCIDESLACVRELCKRGFTGTVCTPHACVDEYPDNVPATIARWVAELQQRITAAGITYQLWAGAEVRLTPGTVDWFQRHGVPTLGASNFVLVDYWGRAWPDYADAALEYLAARRYRPVLAHPERMGLPDDEFELVVSRLVETGVLLQGNLRCITGLDGRLEQRRMHALLGQGRYQLLATDVHGPVDLMERLAGMTEVYALHGAAALAQLLSTRPRSIVAAAEEAGVKRCSRTWAASPCARGVRTHVRWNDATRAKPEGAARRG